MVAQFGHVFKALRQWSMQQILVAFFPLKIVSVAIFNRPVTSCIDVALLSLLPFRTIRCHTHACRSRSR